MKNILASSFTAALLLFSPNLKAQSNSLWGVNIGTDSREVLFQKTGVYKGIPLADSLQGRMSFSGTFEGQPVTMTFDVARAVDWKSTGPDLVYAGYATFDCKGWDTATVAAWIYKLYASEKRAMGRNCDNCKTDYTPESLAKAIGVDQEFNLGWKDASGFLRDIRYLPRKQIIVLGHHYVELHAIIALFHDPSEKR